MRTHCLLPKSVMESEKVQIFIFKSHLQIKKKIYGIFVPMWYVIVPHKLLSIFDLRKFKLSFHFCHWTNRRGILSKMCINVSCVYRGVHMLKKLFRSTSISQKTLFTGFILEEVEGNQWCSQRCYLRFCSTQVRLSCGTAVPVGSLNATSIHMFEKDLCSQMLHLVCLCRGEEVPQRKKRKWSWDMSVMSYGARLHSTVIEWHSCSCPSSCQSCLPHS